MVQYVYTLNQYYPYTNCVFQVGVYAVRKQNLSLKNIYLACALFWAKNNKAFLCPTFQVWKALVSYIFKKILKRMQVTRLQADPQTDHQILIRGVSWEKNKNNSLLRSEKKYGSYFIL